MTTTITSAKTNKGFTLIELLVVIAIIGVLAAVVLLAINPAEILRRSRDSTRLQDLATIRKAIDAAIAQNTSLTALPCANATGSSSGGQRSPRGDGWIGTAGCAGSTVVDLSAFIAVLPIDPVNAANTSVACTGGEGCSATNRMTANAYYYFRSDASMNYELNCYLESTQNLTRLSGDGGNNPNRYEVGTDPGLDLID